MYLSKLVIDTNGLDGRRAVADAYEAHRRIWSAFPDAADGGPGRVMFRLEPFRAGKPVVVLIQSDAGTGLDAACRKRVPGGRSLEGVPANLQGGSALAFQAAGEPDQEDSR